MVKKESDVMSLTDRKKILPLEVKTLKNQLLRSLAEQENTRQNARKDIESARNFPSRQDLPSTIES
jgi:molecular chaperone GrpE (heat shock protein)